ncbi:MAG: maleylpyruvate isomerase family mycothiol-dependent enzyme [Acidimicrobiia bacterium]
MTDVVSRLYTAAAGLTRAIEAAESRAAWDVDSPCEGWTAGDVADHIIDNYASVADTLGSDVKRTGNRSQDWATLRDAVLGAATHAGALDTVVDGPDGQMPLGRLLAVYVEVDTLIHTWDIAHAVGADESLDEGLCRRCYERFLPADEVIRVPGAFGPKLDYTEDDSIQVKALRFFGRPA